MFALCKKKMDIANNGGMAPASKYFPGDVAEGRHAEVLIDAGKGVEISAAEAELPDDHPDLIALRDAKDDNQSDPKTAPANKSKTAPANKSGGKKTPKK